MQATSIQPPARLTLNACAHVAGIRVSDPATALAPSVRTVDTRFTHLVGCRLPFQLAVLGGVGTTERFLQRAV
jgi:hypothetical protein